MIAPGEVMSVTGPVAADRLGVVLPHEHTFVDTMREYRGDGLVNDDALLEVELKRFREAGGGTIVDCTSRGLGGDPARTRRLAERTGVTVIYGTGFYREPFLDDAWLRAHSTDEVADLFIADIREGIDGTGVRAGIIGEIGCDRHLTPAEERVFRAAARAHHETGLTITTHAARWPVGLPQLRLLAEEDVRADRVIIGHCDLVPDPAYHLALADLGAWVEFDQVGMGGPWETERLIGWILRLVEAGHADRLLLSHDVCLRSHASTLGGPGYAYLLQRFIPMLLEAGIDAPTVDRITITNPALALAGDDGWPA